MASMSQEQIVEVVMRQLSFPTEPHSLSLLPAFNEAVQTVLSEERSALVRAQARLQVHIKRTLRTPTRRWCE
jgi:hypothetical protein